MTTYLSLSLLASRPWRNLLLFSWINQTLVPLRFVLVGSIPRNTQRLPGKWNVLWPLLSCFLTCTYLNQLAPASTQLLLYHKLHLHTDYRNVCALTCLCFFVVVIGLSLAYHRGVHVPSTKSQDCSPVHLSPGKSPHSETCKLLFLCFNECCYSGQLTEMHSGGAAKFSSLISLGSHMKYILYRRMTSLIVPLW